MVHLSVRPKEKILESILFKKDSFFEVVWGVQPFQNPVYRKSFNFLIFIHFRIDQNEYMLI